MSLSILVVEDDAVARVVVLHTLRRIGYDAEVATSGAEAWEALAGQHFDVVLSDWIMADMDGLELCRAIRDRYEQEAQTPYTYFMLLTALTARESRLEAIRAGVDDYLTKPLDRHELLLRLIVAERVARLHRRLEEQARESERLNRELHESVRLDMLTGVSNRYRLQEDLAVLASGGARHLAIAIADIDHFKEYNEHYLHLRGDETLRNVALSLEAVLKDSPQESGARLYRYGGEEFVAILDGCPMACATATAERLRGAVEALAIPHAGNPGWEVVTVSIGLADVTLPPDRAAAHKALAAALLDADRALFQAKGQGRNRVVAAEVA